MDPDSGRHIPLAARRRKVQQRRTKLEALIDDISPPQEQLKNSRHGQIFLLMQEYFDLCREGPSLSASLMHAERYFRLAEQAPDFFSPCLINLANTYWYIGRESKALEYYDRALEQNLVQAHFHKAELFYQGRHLRDLDKALDALNTYIDKVDEVSESVKKFQATLVERRLRESQA